MVETGFGGVGWLVTTLSKWLCQCFWWLAKPLVDACELVETDLLLKIQAQEAGKWGGLDSSLWRLCFET